MSNSYFCWPTEVTVNTYFGGVAARTLSWVSRCRSSTRWRSPTRRWRRSTRPWRSTRETRCASSTAPPSCSLSTSTRHVRPAAPVQLDCTQSLSFLLVIEGLGPARCTAARETGVSEMHGRARDWSERDARLRARLEWARCTAARETGVSEMHGRARDWSERGRRPRARLEWARCTAARETGVSEMHGRARDWSERDARPRARLEWARCTAARETGVSEVDGRACISLAPVSELLIYCGREKKGTACNLLFNQPLTLGDPGADRGAEGKLGREDGRRRRGRGRGEKGKFFYVFLPLSPLPQFPVRPPTRLWVSEDSFRTIKLTRS